MLVDLGQIYGICLQKIVTIQEILLFGYKWEEDISNLVLPMVLKLIKICTSTLHTELLSVFGIMLPKSLIEVLINL